MNVLNRWYSRDFVLERQISYFPIFITTLGGHGRVGRPGCDTFEPEGQVSFGGQIITHLRYTDNTTLITRTSEELYWNTHEKGKAASEQFRLW